MSIGRKAVRGGLWSAGINYVSYFCNFVCNIWLARLLVPENFGVFALATSIADIIFMLGGFGFVQACIQMQDEPDVFDTGLVISFGLCLVLALFGAGVATVFYSKAIYSIEVSIFLVTLCLIKSVRMPASIFLAVLDKELRFRRSAFVSAISSSLSVGLAVILAMRGWNEWSLLMREVAAFGFFLVGAVLFSPYSFGFSFNRVTARKLWSFSLGMYFQVFSSRLTSSLPSFVIGSLAGTGVLGLFNRSFYLSRLPNRMLNPFFGRVAFSIYSKVKNEAQKIAYGMEWNLFLSCRITFLAGALTLLFPKYLLISILGGQWEPAAGFFQGFAPFIVFGSIFAVLQQGFFARGSINPVTWCRIISAVVTAAGIGLAWALGGRWVIVSWATSAGTMLGAAILMLLCHKEGIYVRWLYVVRTPLILSVIAISLNVIFSQVNDIIRISITIGFWAIIILILDFKKLKEFSLYIR